MARGQALMDDALIGYVVLSLRSCTPPTTPSSSRRSRSECFRGPCSIGCTRVSAAWSFSRRCGPSRGPPAAIPTRGWHGASSSTSKTWRGLGDTHDAIGPLVDALSAQYLGPYRNPLDERAAELSDPAEVPGAAHLAERLAETRDRGRSVWIEPDRGVDIALLPMLRAVVGDRVSRLEPGDRPAAGDFLLRAGSVRPLLLFKALQLLQCRGMADPLQDYVAFDLETTEKDPAECEIVELAAVRVRGRVIVEQFQRLVRPSRPITRRRPPSTATRTRTSATSPPWRRSGRRSASSWAVISSWPTMATPSTCPCSAGSRTACRVSTSSCSSTRCRWLAH